MPTPLILGSSSRYRAAALRTLGLEFQQISPDVDESPRKGEPPGDLALRLAQDKARYLAQRYPGAVVIGSDQVGSCERRRLRKPGTQANAIQSLQQCSGKLATFYTALALARSAPNGEIEITGGISVTELKFRTLNAEQIEYYVQQDMPTDAAGAFKAEGLGISLFDYVRAEDPSALIGLPLIALTTYLKDFGIDPLTGRVGL
jgi:septum formation protein